MKSSKITWEIVFVGILLTAVAIYFHRSPQEPNWNDRASTGVATATQPQKNDSSDPQKAKILIINPYNLLNIKAIDTLTSANNVDTLISRLHYIKKHAAYYNKNTDVTIKNIAASIDSALSELSNQNYNNISVTSDNGRLIVKEDNKPKFENSGILIQKKEYTVPGIKSISMKSPGGNINVEGYDGKTITASVVAEKSAKNRKNFDKYYEVRIFKDGSTVNVDISKKGSFGFLNVFHNYPANIYLHIPSNLEVKGSTSGGSLKAHNLNGKINLHTMGGQVNLTNVQGQVHIKTMGGEITAQNVGGDVTLHTIGGSVTVNKSSGKLDVSTDGGQLQLHNISGELSARTLAGNISVSLADLTKDVFLKDKAGNIAISIPQNATAKLDINGSKVHYSTALKITGDISNKHIHGSLNGGKKPLIQANTLIGDVNLDVK